MSRPNSSTFDALQAHFKAGLSQPSTFSPPQVQQGTDGENTRRQNLPGSGQGQHDPRLNYRAQAQTTSHQDVSRTSSLSSYLDPLILASDGYRDAAWNSQGQANLPQKRKTDDALIDPRLSKTPRYDYSSFPGTEATRGQLGQHESATDFTNSSNSIPSVQKYTYPPPSDASATVDNSPLPQGFGSNSFDHGSSSKSQNANGVHRAASASDMGIANSLIDSATDALLERQLDLQGKSDEESELENRRKGPSRYDDDDDDDDDAF
ncbi:hypothetical protein ONZ43_g4958 [Nemania bipapillata]|uniref:Uncharacterized protein n=1 Tax=Nemania bipapillata TaxID=110536 RepID=A0ACC2IG85_9PEZI|nr:hypothetical protein ONZ43_g4958 [Nemania bipapillata]